MSGWLAEADQHVFGEELVSLANVGYHISDTTVGNILKADGIEPAPDRQHTGSWSTFLKPRWAVLAAIDSTTIEVWTKGGFVTFYLLFVMELKLRRVHFAGCNFGIDPTILSQGSTEIQHFKTTQAVFIPEFDGCLSFFTERPSVW